MERLCEYCKKPFVPKRADALYCGQSCRQLAYVLRKASGQVALGEKPQVTQTSELHQIKTQESLTILTDKEQLTLEEKELFNVLTDNDANPSKQGYKTTRQVSEKGDAEEKEAKLTVKTKSELNPKEEIEHKSLFLQELNALIEQRGNLDILDEWNTAAEDFVYWVNIRYRCLAECLLILSERTSVNLDDLKEICNAFTSLAQTEQFEELPSEYPYTKEILTMKGVLKDFCTNSDEEGVVSFNFKRETKLKMLATRWELANFVEKKPFNTLKFD